MTRIQPLALTVAMSFLAVVTGYATLAIGSTLVQEVWLGGVSYQQSPRSTLILAGVFTPLCAFAGGAVAATVGRRAPLWSGTVLSMIIVAESTFLYATRRVDGPLWFEAGAAAALVIAVMGACWLLKGRPSRQNSATPRPPDDRGILDTPGGARENRRPRQSPFRV